jgi:hypothetical protein
MSDGSLARFAGAKSSDTKDTKDTKENSGTILASLRHPGSSKETCAPPAPLAGSPDAEQSFVSLVSFVSMLFIKFFR